LFFCLFFIFIFLLLSALLPAILYMEGQQMVDEHAERIVLDNLPLFLLAGLLGFAVNVLSFFVIQFTSSITLKVVAKMGMVVGIENRECFERFHRGSNKISIFLIVLACLLASLRFSQWHARQAWCSSARCSWARPCPSWRLADTPFRSPASPGIPAPGACQK
jgi:hypothetical protein